MKTSTRLKYVHKVKTRFRINHLLQEVEQVDDHAHAEVDGVGGLDEVEGLDQTTLSDLKSLKKFDLNRLRTFYKFQYGSRRTPGRF